MGAADGPDLAAAFAVAVGRSVGRSEDGPLARRNRCQEQGLHEVADFVAAAREMLGWDETQLWAWWTGEERDAALAWQAQGRVGEDVVELVCAATTRRRWFGWLD